MINITLLITSAGGLVGTYLLKHFRKNPLYNYRLIAVDTHDLVPGLLWADSFHLVPQTSKPSYEEELIDILKKESVDYIIPGASHDIDFFASWNNSEWKDKYLCLDADTLEMLHNKKTLYHWAKNANICVPDIYESLQDFQFPVIAKPLKSSGGKGVIRLWDEQDLKSFICKNNPENFIFMRLLNGREYTVDCLYDLKHALVGYHVRERIKTVGGGATISKSATNTDVSILLNAFTALNKLLGPVNFQIIIEETTAKAYLIDFNPRFASGGLPLTVKCGFDIPNKLVEILVTGKTEPIDQKDLIPMTMVRYYEEYFIE